VGPRFGEGLVARIELFRFVVFLFPYIHRTVATAFTILGIEALYFLAPNGKRQFRATLPGATLAVGFWLALSYGLDAYFSHFGIFDKTYGTLGAVIALLVWLYWGGFAVLLGAELNAELANDRRDKSNREREPVPTSKMNHAA
jgi:membrane protein